mmetsp:Transcript_68092/g.197327  ORF Transcript_68092/g.197327 Transcript_68092/m.197327 type:complete len:216 (-) Transcript_68092:111-758(-)
MTLRSASIGRRRPIFLERPGQLLAVLCWATPGLPARTHISGHVQLGGNMTLDETGAVLYPNGTKWDAFEDVEREAPLRSNAFECHNGSPVSLRFPAVAGRPEQHIHLRPSFVRKFWPVQLYTDSHSMLENFFIVPPLTSLDRQWTLLYFGAWVNGTSPAHAFPLGEQHPCGPAGDWEAEVAAAMSRGGSPPSPPRRSACRALWSMVTAIEGMESS